MNKSESMYSTRVWFQLSSIKKRKMGESLAKMTATPKTVVLADDHTIIRHAVKTILEQDGQYKVIGESGNADDTITTIKELKPNFLILDLGLPGKKWH